VFRLGGPSITLSLLAPLLIMALAYTLLFATLWIVRIRTEIMTRRAAALAVKMAGAA
jgi:heme exporter protein C